MLIIAGIIAAVLIVLYLYFLLNKAVEEPKKIRRTPEEDPEERE